MTQARRILLVATACAAVWAYAIFLTGGFEIHLRAFALRSRNVRNPLAFAVLTGLAAWSLSTAGARRSTLASDWKALTERIPRVRPTASILRRSAHLAAIGASLIVVFIGVSKGALVAGGADSYGYVSQAHLWATGRLHLDSPLLHQVRWPFAADALSPLGYRPARDGAELVPTYAPGLPMLMGICERLAGRRALFYVVPVLGGVTVLATYLLGLRFGGASVGLAAALLMATSPPFLFQLMFPMSDVPVAAWWTVALAFPFVRGTLGAVTTGISAALATLTRPNLVPLLLIPLTFLLWRTITEPDRSESIKRLSLFVAATLAACVAIALLNSTWYGSPLRSGYGSPTDLYSWQNFTRNLSRYPRWLVEAHTPVILLALIAPLVVRRRADASAPNPSRRLVAIMWLVFIGAVLASYMFYEPFDAWWYSRFLLPALPPLFVLMSAVLIRAVSVLPAGSQAIAMVAIITLLMRHGLVFVGDRAGFTFREGERKYVAIGEYIARRLPERAVLIAMQHSGSANYYSGRPTLRYDAIPPAQFDAVLADVRDLGYRPFIVLEQWEEDAFRDRFRGHSELGLLDWPPLARLQHASPVAVYDPAQKHATTRPATEIIH